MAATRSFDHHTSFENIYLVLMSARFSPHTSIVAGETKTNPLPLLPPGFAKIFVPYLSTTKDVARRMQVVNGLFSDRFTDYVGKNMMCPNGLIGKCLGSYHGQLSLSSVRTLQDPSGQQRTSVAMLVGDLSPAVLKEMVLTTTKTFMQSETALSGIDPNMLPYIVAFWGVRNNQYAEFFPRLEPSLLPTLLPMLAYGLLHSPAFSSFNVNGGLFNLPNLERMMLDLLHSLSTGWEIVELLDKMAFTFELTSESFKKKFVLCLVFKAIPCPEIAASLHVMDACYDEVLDVFRTVMVACPSYKNYVTWLARKSPLRIRFNAMLRDMERARSGAAEVIDVDAVTSVEGLPLLDVEAALAAEDEAAEDEAAADLAGQAPWQETDDFDNYVPPPPAEVIDVSSDEEEEPEPVYRQATAAQVQAAQAQAAQAQAAQASAEEEEEEETQAPPPKRLRSAD